MKLSLFSCHRWRNGGRVKSFHWRQTTLLNGGARRIRNQDVWFQSPYFLTILYHPCASQIPTNCGFHQLKRGIDGSRNSLWGKNLSFHIQIVRRQWALDLQIQKRKKKKKKTEIAYSLREEKVINYIKVMEPSPRCNPQWKGTSTLW